MHEQRGAEDGAAAEYHAAGRAEVDGHVSPVHGRQDARGGGSRPHGPNDRDVALEQEIVAAQGALEICRHGSAPLAIVVVVLGVAKHGRLVVRLLVNIDLGVPGPIDQPGPGGVVARLCVEMTIL